MQKNSKNEKSKQLEIILTNYMKILNAQGKYKETLSIFALSIFSDIFIILSYKFT